MRALLFSLAIALSVPTAHAAGAKGTSARVKTSKRTNKAKQKSSQRGHLGRRSPRRTTVRNKLSRDAMVRVRSASSAKDALLAVHDAPGLRSRLGREIKIRHVPELRFAHDDSAAEAQRISSLIDAALDSDQSDEQR